MKPPSECYLPMNTSRLLVALALTSALIVGCSGGSAIASMSPTPAGSSTATKDCTNIGAFADLQGCDFSGANLQLAFLLNADLRGANLRGARLIYADLSGADLSGADLSFADLTGVDFINANLSGANLSGANFERANLNGVIGLP